MANGEGKESQKIGAKPKVRVIAPIEGMERRAQMAPTPFVPVRSRTCTYHSTIPAVYICAKCQKPLCLSCAVPHGHLFLCPQCYQPPPPVQTSTEEAGKEPPKPTIESIIGLFGAIMMVIGFFMPWVSSEYESPGNNGNDVISGFTVAGDYPEAILILTMAILIIVIEFLILILSTSPTMVKKPPIGIRLLPMFLGFVAYVILAEVALRAENFINNIQFGWFVCLLGANLTLLRGVVAIIEHYRGEPS